MPKYDAYVLRIWHDDRQWAARLEHLPDGAVLRFANPGALLTYLDGAGFGEHPGLKAEIDAHSPGQAREPEGTDACT